jgi:hypothetical protein
MAKITMGNDEFILYIRKKNKKGRISPLFFIHSQLFGTQRNTKLKKVSPCNNIFDLVKTSKNLVNQKSYQVSAIRFQLSAISFFKPFNL